MSPQELLAHCDEAREWPQASRPTHGDLDAAYQDALAVRALRAARGERPAGWKIGFTNRTIWDRYDVHAPIWGTVWNTTLFDLDAARGVDLGGLCQPRLEPEVVFGIAATPPAQPSLQQLFDCVEWLAPGFEIVQSHAPGWRFNAAETVADGGLHGRLYVGPRQPVRALAAEAAAFDDRLAVLRVDLSRDGTIVDAGRGCDVLDGPLHALRHFVLEMQRCPGAPALQHGEVVTTGTWTDAWPLEPGQRWRAAFDAVLPAVELGTR